MFCARSGDPIQDGDGSEDRLGDNPASRNGSYTRDEIIGPENCLRRSFIYSEDLYRVRNNCENFIDGESHFSSHRIVTKSGDLRWGAGLRTLAQMNMMGSFISMATE